MPGRRAVSKSTERTIAVAILAVGTVASLASLLGGVWVVRAGVVVAVGLRVTLTLFAAELLQVGGLRLLGALLLLWIGVALCGEENSEAEVGERDTLLAAIRTILFADLATGLDNVVAVAAVADASASGARSLLVACGLGLSIPIVIFGSGLMVQLVRRLPALVMLGGALLGGVAGELLVHERLLAPLRRRGVQSK